MRKQLLERFLRYVKIDTQSAEGQADVPSTEKQLDLARLLHQEMEAMGLKDVTLDSHGYVMGTLPANTPQALPRIGFIAHMDTSPDASGQGVKPILWEDYDGGELTLSPGNVLSPADFPELTRYKGCTLVTSDGTTLLGADDKAGVAEILTAIEYLQQHPEIPHGDIRIGFTPDEEIGRGPDFFDVKRFDADWAYTLDGSAEGELEYENFNGAAASVTFYGLSVHPGYAKDKMVNSMLRAAEFIQMLPPAERPEHTEGYEGFYHLHSMEASLERTTLSYILRDHDRTKFEHRKAVFTAAAEYLKQKYGEKALDYVQACLTDEGELIDPMETLRSVYPNAMQIIRAGREEIQMEFYTGAVAGRGSLRKRDAGSLFQDFYAEIKEQEMTEEQLHYITGVIREAKERLEG